MIVVVPAYQPDEKLLGVVSDFNQAAPTFSIVIVDDGSRKECEPIFSELEQKDNVTVLHHSQNKGKGAALKTAFQYISERFPDSDGIITVDADGQHLISDALEVCKALHAHPDMLITGSRRFTGKVPFRSRLGNAITRTVFHLTTGKKLYDTQTGLRAFAANRIPEMISLQGDRYEYEINQLLYCCTKSTGVFEVPIETIYINENKSSHFNTIRDSAKIYRVIFRYLGPTFLKFISSSLLSFLIDLVGFCIVFYGIVALFAGWDTAKSLFSFLRDAPVEQLRALESINPIVFASAGSYLRIFSLVIARIVSALANYLMNKRFVFRSGSTFARGCLPRYALAAITVLALNAFFLELFTRFGVPAWLANIFAQLICYPVSYFSQRVFVFRNKERT